MTISSSLGQKTGREAIRGLEVQIDLSALSRYAELLSDNPRSARRLSEKPGLPMSHLVIQRNYPEDKTFYPKLLEALAKARFSVPENELASALQRIQDFQTSWILTDNNVFVPAREGNPFYKAMKKRDLNLFIELANYLKEYPCPVSVESLLRVGNRGCLLRTETEYQGRILSVDMCNRYSFFGFKPKPK